MLSGRPGGVAPRRCRRLRPITALYIALVVFGIADVLTSMVDLSAGFSEGNPTATGLAHLADTSVPLVLATTKFVTIIGAGIVSKVCLRIDNPIVRRSPLVLMGGLVIVFAYASLSNLTFLHL